MRRLHGTGAAFGGLCAALAVTLTGCGGGGGPAVARPGHGDVRAPGASAAPSAPVGSPSPAPSDRLVVRTANGVRLRPAAGGRASVHGAADGHWSHHDGVWVLDLTCPGSGPCARMPTVEVPAGLPVTVAARDAGIDVAGLTGGLSLSTVNGDVTGTGVGASGASVALATRNGSVRATGLAAASLTASTVNGDVVLGCAHAPGSVNAATTNGSVDLTVPRGAPAYAVRAATRDGRSRIDVPTRGGGAGTLTLRTVNGDVTASEGA
ncbi:DUF4097 family beta strand repeat-containing protein [Streptomyces sp. DW26H14]|uniref:DUF4097 family beta strand repeat-containing protein n=1 Tax=Streptomyces sp. DW26H14 TaxID=3435395 RepID=UPI00403E2900